MFHVEHFCESQDEKRLMIVVVATYAGIAAPAKSAQPHKGHEGTRRNKSAQPRRYTKGDRAADSLSRKASTTEGTEGHRGKFDGG